MARIVPWLEALDVIPASRDVLRKEPGHSEFIHSIVIGRLAARDSVGGGWNVSAVWDCHTSPSSHHARHSDDLRTLVRMDERVL